jgi:uncharacterized protein with HEPN domain
VSLERDEERLETILGVIADLERRLGGMDLRTFSGDRDEIDLTAFRLSVIGENANKLSEGVKARNPALPWKGMYGFRNLVSHEYTMIAPRFVWAATQELEPIRDMARAELARIRDAEAE